MTTDQSPAANESPKTRTSIRKPVLLAAAALIATGALALTLGKGVPFGAPERLVCWYQLRETGKYRAVYADLEVNDVNPDELPLPVDFSP